MKNLFAKYKGYIQDLSTGETFTFPRNPTELDLGYTAVRASQVVPGLSHQRRQWISNTIEPLKFTVYMDGIRDGGAQAVDAARSFLESLTFPRSLNREVGVGASQYLLVFPSSRRVQGSFDSVKLKETLWYTDGKLRAFECELEFTPELKKRTTDKEIRNRRSMSSNATDKNRRGILVDFRQQVKNGKMI